MSHSALIRTFVSNKHRLQIRFDDSWRTRSLGGKLPLVSRHEKRKTKQKKKPSDNNTKLETTCYIIHWKSLLLSQRTWRIHEMPLSGFSRFYLPGAEMSVRITRRVFRDSAVFDQAFRCSAHHCPSLLVTKPSFVPQTHKRLKRTLFNWTKRDKIFFSERWSSTLCQVVLWFFFLLMYLTITVSSDYTSPDPRIQTGRCAMSDIGALVLLT